MRRYRRPVLLCSLCGQPITGEVRMVDGQLRHPWVCVAKAVAS